MKLLEDPRILNYVLLALYFANSARWMAAKSGPQALYWLGAFVINSAVTWQASLK